MSHKVHPKVFRIEGTADWDSRWFNEKNLPEYLEEDFIIREFLEKRLKECGVQDIQIERFSNKVNVIIASFRPGLIIGRGGEETEKLKKEIGKKILKSKKSLFTKHKNDKQELKIEIREIRDPWARARLAGRWVASQLEKRVRHRKVMKQVLSKIMANKIVKGARIELAGRLNGVEIARREWLGKGCLPRQTLRADIDYAQSEAHCSYGVIGVKIWIYKGERSE